MSTKKRVMSGDEESEPGLEPIRFSKRPSIISIVDTEDSFIDDADDEDSDEEEEEEDSLLYRIECIEEELKKMNKTIRRLCRSASNKKVIEDE